MREVGGQVSRCWVSADWRRSQRERPEGKRQEKLRLGMIRQNATLTSPTPTLHLCVRSAHTFSTPEGSWPANPLIHSQEDPVSSMTMKPLRLRRHLSPSLPRLSPLSPRSPPLLLATPFWASVSTHTGGSLP